MNFVLDVCQLALFKWPFVGLCWSALFKWPFVDLCWSALFKWTLFLTCAGQPCLNYHFCWPHVAGQPISDALLLSTTSNTNPEADPELAVENELESLKDEVGGAASENNDEDTAEHVKVLIEDCKKLLVPELDNVVGAWGLVDNDPVSGEQLKSKLGVSSWLRQHGFMSCHVNEKTFPYIWQNMVLSIFYFFQTMLSEYCFEVTYHEEILEWTFLFLLC